MSALDTAMNALGTGLALKSLFGGNGSGPANSKVSKFMTEIRSTGVARTNQFEIVITPPKCMTGSSQTAQKLSLYAEGAVLPGRTIQTQEFSRFGYGPHEKFPYSMQYQDYTVQFIGDGRGEIYKFFYNWMQNIVRGDLPVSDAGTAFEVDFRENYCVPMSVYMFNEQGDKVLASDMTNAFPIQVPDVSLNWSDSSMMQFSVTFAYTLAQLQDSDEILIGKNGGIQPLTTLQKLVKIGTAAQTIASIRRPSNVQDALSSVTNVKNVINGF
jgi:hypothetical protein